MSLREKYLRQWILVRISCVRVQPLIRTVDVGEDERCGIIPFLKSLDQRFVEYYPGHKGRATLDDVALRFPSLQSFLCGY